MQNYHILIVEDDPDIANILKLYLESNQYGVFLASDGEKALEIFFREKIHYVLLDIMLPKKNGYEVMKEIRKNSTVPVIFLSAKDQEMDKILGLDLGADDYIAKPFSPLEVIARVKAGLRRCYEMKGTGEEEKKECYVQVGEILLNHTTMAVMKNKTEINLTPFEFKILSLLMGQPGRVYAKSQLYEAVNGDYFEGDDKTMMVHICNLRDKLEDDPKNPKYIKTIRGIGYKFEKQEK